MLVPSGNSASGLVWGIFFCLALFSVRCAKHMRTECLIHPVPACPAVVHHGGVCLAADSTSVPGHG